MDEDYPCRGPLSLNQMRGADKPSPLPQCNPIMDEDYPCRGPLSLNQAYGPDLPSRLARCNPMMDKDYPCETNAQVSAWEQPGVRRPTFNCNGFDYNTGICVSPSDMKATKHEYPVIKPEALVQLNKNQVKDTIQICNGTNTGFCQEADTIETKRKALVQID